MICEVGTRDEEEQDRRCTIRIIFEHVLICFSLVGRRSNEYRDLVLQIISRTICFDEQQPPQSFSYLDTGIYW